MAKKNGALLAVLFGSHARKTATKRSDIDILFVEETNDAYLQRLERYFFPLVDALHESIDVFVYTPSEFIRMKERFFVKKAIEEGEIIFEQGKI